MRSRELNIGLAVLLLTQVTFGQIPLTWPAGILEGIQQQHFDFAVQQRGYKINPGTWLYTLDSILEMTKDSTGVNWIYSDAQSFGFDSLMRFNKQAMYWYSPDMGSFEPIQKDTIVFRFDGRVDTHYRYFGNVAKTRVDGWTLVEYDVYSYAPDTQIIVKYVANQQGVFLPVNKNVDIFYPDGNLKEMYYYEADSTGVLMPVSKREYMRSGGLLTQETGYNFYIPWNNWIFNDHTDYVYAGTWNILTFRYIYDAGTMQWRNFEKEINDYDAQGRLISRFNYSWNDNSNDYLPSWGFTQSYTTHGDPDTLIYFESPDQASFIPFMRQINNYDEFLNPYKTSIWWYNYYLFIWEPIELTEVIYNNNVSTEQLLWPPFIDSMNMRHMAENVYNYMWDGQDWAMYKQMHLFYQYRQFTGLENLKSVTGGLFPNPFDHFLYVEGEGNGLLELTDMNGKRVMFVSLQLPAVVNTSSLSAGIYIYRLQKGSTIEVGKLIRR